MGKLTLVLVCTALLVAVVGAAKDQQQQRRQQPTTTTTTTTTAAPTTVSEAASASPSDAGLDLEDAPISPANSNGDATHKEHHESDHH